MITLKNDDRFNHLMKALETGWEIEEPVLLGAMWRTNAERGGAYHFLLRHRSEERTTMMSLAPSAKLLLFLAEHNVQVSPLS